MASQTNRYRPAGQGYTDKQLEAWKTATFQSHVKVQLKNMPVNPGIQFA